MASIENRIEKIKELSLHALPQDIAGMFIFGSYARDDSKPGHSDLNILIVLDNCGEKELIRLSALQKKAGRNFSILAMTEKFLKSSLDTFPVEILDFKLFHKLIHGNDVFAELEISPEFLRIQCERELKGKLNLLRQVFISSGFNERQLISFLKDHLPAIAAVFQGILYLKGIQIPAARIELIKKTGEIYTVQAKLTESLVQIAGTGKLSLSHNISNTYFSLIDGLENLADQIDQMETAV
ncbi:MAG: nucleotidyltransferase domain-containing protein [FCB group bacterium]|nr:nucleotidyltransferase domain-containing protein [FCB group bacterium]